MYLKFLIVFISLVLGIYVYHDVKFSNSSYPLVWALFVFIFKVVGFPFYLITRYRKFGFKYFNNVSVIVCIIVFITNLVFYGLINTDIYKQKYEHSSSVESVNVQSKRKEDEGLSKYEAETVSQSLITRFLKAPATAKFAPYSAWNSIVYSDGVIVSSYVDSQNSFGAMLRSYFKVYFVLKTSNVYDVKVYFNNENIYNTTYKLGSLYIY